MQYEKKGNIVVNITTAGGALPSEGAVVRVSGADSNNGGIIYSFLTDADGTIRNVELPAPPRVDSLLPGPKETPYALYDIKVSLEGYYTFRISDVAVFEGETSVVPINLIPMPLHMNNISYPRGNLVTISRENEMLE
jgi:hypothetical protein